MPVSTPTCTSSARSATVPSAMTMISADRMKSVRIAPRILSFSTASSSSRERASAARCAAWCASSSAFRVQQLVRDLLEALVAQEQAADHQQRRDRPRQECADRERGGHQDQLVAHRPLRHRPDHGQLALGAHAADLFRVQREVVAEHARGLLRGDLGHHRHVVEDRGDVVEQQEEARGHVRRAACARSRALRSARGSGPTSRRTARRARAGRPR